MPGSVETRHVETLHVETPRVKTLLAAMTLEEKIGQLTMASGEMVGGRLGVTPSVAEAIAAGHVGSLLNLWGPLSVREVQRLALERSRLKIPLFFSFDVLHGHRTVFPIPLGEAAAFSPDLWERTARAAAREAARDGISLSYAPMLDLARDPRWGRMAEGPGEDPWVGSRFAEAKVRGFQGDDLATAGGVAATAKHMGAYGAVTAGRDYASIDISERSLRELHLPAFKAAVDAGVAAVMAAFPDIAGVPATGNARLLRDILRGEWGFDGIVVSDYGAVAELVAHGVAADIAEAAALALKAGVDIDMTSKAYPLGLPVALARGLVSMDEIDAAVSRVLRFKERLGLFEDPYRGLADGAGTVAPVEPPLDRDLAREAARRSIVLLTNDGVLPLAREAGRIALIGPFAAAASEMLGPWTGAGHAAESITIADGLSAALPEAAISVVAGVSIDGPDGAGIAKAVETARLADAVVLCLGEAADMSGEAASRARVDLPGCQRELAEAVLALGKPVVAVLFSGRPLILPWLVARAAAVVAAWFPGHEAGHAVADVLTGAFNPVGRLPLSWPYDVGQIPIFYAERPTGRPVDAANRYTSKYLDVPTTPQFPFGHGLSYTRFTLGEPRPTSPVMKRGDQIFVEVEVTNEGQVAGEETLFLFIHDVVASIARPVLELKDVAKISLLPGASGTARLALTGEALTFPGLDLAPAFEAGDIALFVGVSADRAHLRRTTIRLIDP